jgi:ABC-type lipoprotein export system ATPase subunit
MLLIKNVKKSFHEPGGGRLPILDIEEFRVAAGEQAVLLGRSGCGKTTLLHVIAGISTPDSGEIRVDGRDITQLDEAGRDRLRAETIGYVFQSFNLLSGFSALENVLLGLAFGQGRHDAARARELLGLVGLSHRHRHKPAELSVGEQQRVAVARALANRPRLLLADEPTASVDSRHQQTVIDLIRQTCEEEGVALLLVTHAPDVAARFERAVHLENLNKVAATL